MVGGVAEVDVDHADIAGERGEGHAAVLVGVLPGPVGGALVALDELARRVVLGVHERDVALVDFWLLVDELKDALGAGKAHDHGVDLLRDLADLAAELLGHVEEGDYHGDGQRHARDREVRDSEGK